MPPQEYDRGSGENKTNEQCLGLTQEQKESYATLCIPDSIYGLTLAWITSENSTKQLECRHLDSIFFAGPYPMLPRLSARVSTVDRPCPWFHANSSADSPLCCPVANCLSAPFPNQLPFVSPYHFRILRDFRSKNPLSGFAPKQTKESSAWRATHIVLQFLLGGVEFTVLFSLCSLKTENVLSSPNSSTHRVNLFVIFVRWS